MKKYCALLAVAFLFGGSAAYVVVSERYEDRHHRTFYVPGVAPRSFDEGEEVPLMVNKLTSEKTQLPLDYYSLPFCRPEQGIEMAEENWGQLLAGDRIQNSPYKLKMKQDVFCGQVCTVEDLGQDTVDAIHNLYHHNWILDNLPAASKLEDEETITTRFWGGFPVGVVEERDGTAYIHNHVNIEIMYHRVETDQDKYRVVRFTVEPFSIKHDFVQHEANATTALPVAIKNPIASCDTSHTTKQHTNWDMVTAVGRKPQEAASGPVLFTYDVTWVEDTYVRWANRWDIFLTMDNAIPHRVHWFSIMNSLVVVVVVSAILILVWKRMTRDITNYRKATKDGQSVDEDPTDYRCVDRLICFVSCGILGLFWIFWEWVVGARTAQATTTTQVRGWKAVQADVFRPPSTAPMLLSVACGTGAQLLCTAFFTILISALGLVSPARRGYTLMTVLVLFALMGPVCGYVTCRLHKAFGEDKWRLTSFVAALGFPGFAIIVGAVIYRASGFDQSTYAAGFKVWGIVIALWLGVMTPLVFTGAYLGHRRAPIWFPVKPSATPRAIPGSPWVRNLAIVPLSIVLCGILPFGSVFVELYFILSAIWMSYSYYAYGFLLLVLVITTITCAVMAILFTYMQLRLEDYRWWWRSFLNGGSMALYVFLYSTIPFVESSIVDNSVLYIGYMAVVSLGLFCMTGFVGVCASLWFTKMVFAAGEDEESDQPLVGGAAEIELAVPAVV